MSRRRSEESVSVPNNELGALSSLLSETAADASSTYQNNLHALVATLSERRSARLAHLATTYPAVHYAVLTAIAASISALGALSRFSCFTSRPCAARAARTSSALLVGAFC